MFHPTVLSGSGTGCRRRRGRSGSWKTPGWRPVTRADSETLGLGSRIGRPIPDLSVHLLDADLNLVPEGVPGEIHVGGAALSSGYLNRPYALAPAVGASISGDGSTVAC